MQVRNMGIHGMALVWELLVIVCVYVGSWKW